MSGPPAGVRPEQSSQVRVLNPRQRVPISLIIDDSTCLVNLAHYCIPPFAEVFPNQYKQNWRSLPREIPDSFVREFGEWCHENGVKGKYSIVPYPACVGWVDREMPGWTRSELNDSLDLVRTLMMPDWDIHPEMISHTWVIDTKTGRPYPERTAKFMENWDWTTGRSTDELADYISYALRVLDNAGLTCEGVTTPGGFGNRGLNSLAEGTMQACRDVFHTQVPHYFRHIFTDDRSVVPRVECAADLKGSDPRCVVSIIGCTGDWFGGWDGLTPSSPDLCITKDLSGGRLPEVIAREEPAVMVCHWPGFYYNGDRIGFRIFQEVVRRLRERYSNLIWMKLSEISRYWAARVLTTITYQGGVTTLNAPYETDSFTLLLPGTLRYPAFRAGGDIVELKECALPLDLSAGTYHYQDDATIVCINLPQGESKIEEMQSDRVRPKRA